MGRVNALLAAFNRGIVSKLAFARTDQATGIARIRMSAAQQTNWMPRVLGSMSLRPGLQYIGATKDNNKAIHIPFIFSNSDQASLELTDEYMRVRIGDDLIQRPIVSTLVTNGTFGSNVTNWTDADESGASSVWVTGGYLGLTGTGFNSAIRTQEVTVASSDQNTEHALTVVIQRGPVNFKVGSTSGADNYITATSLGTGTHSLSFTPTGSFHIHVSSPEKFQTLVDSIQVGNSGTDSGTGGIAASSGATVSAATTTKNFAIKFTAPSTTTLITAQCEVLSVESGARYWRARKVNAAQNGPFYNEVKVYDASGEVTLTSGMFSQSGLVAFSASQMVDGVLGGYNGFSCETSPAGSYFKIDLGTAKNINKWKFYTSGYNTDSWSIQYSTDDTNWTTAGTLNVNQVGGAGWREVSFTVSEYETITYRAQLYSDSAGSPSAAIGSATAVVDMTTTGTKTFTFSTPPSITNATDYWIVFESISGVASLVIDTVANQAGFSSGRHNTITSITNNLPSTEDWRIVILLNGAGDTEMAIPAPWAEDDLDLIRWSQINDVVFIAAYGYQQYKIERRGDGRSWSVVKYEPLDGPFRSPYTGLTTLTPSAISGDITLTASSALFQSTHVGALFQITSSGQLVSVAANGAGQWSDPIRVVGVDDGRKFSLTITGTWTATVSLQRSVGEIGNWADVVTYTSNQSTTYDDTLDNQIIYYRIGIDTGDYTSGTATASLSYASGAITGVVKITAYSSSTSVTASVVKTLGGITATPNWAEGEWSDYRGWPSSVSLPEGRLSWAGKGKNILSVTDAYSSFDDSVEGDSGTINRSIGVTSDTVAWQMVLQRLVMGTGTGIISVRSSSLDEPLSPTAYNPRPPVNTGSANIPPVVIDSRGAFVHSGLKKLLELTYTGDFFDYEATNLTELWPEASGDGGFVRIVAQRSPDTRIHCVRADGKVAILVSEPAEEVRAWVLFETDGFVEDADVLPGDDEDKVYYTVRRSINGVETRYREKWAKESECVGTTLNKQADSFVTYSGAATTTITGLTHLANRAVVVWADGIDYSPDVLAEANGIRTFTQTTYTVSSTGVLTLNTAVSNAVVGIPYESRFVSTKLAFGENTDTALNQQKRIYNLSLMLADTHALGLYFGDSIDTLDPMSDVEAGTAIDEDAVYSEYDADAMEFDGSYDTDTRLVLVAKAPRPCTVLGAVIGMATNKKHATRDRNGD